MSKYFTNLHLHTDYSLLDGAISLSSLIQFAKTNQMPSLAITDHGNIFGAVKFFQTCKKNNIKPVLGMEAYLTEDATIKNAQNKYYHLILLVENEIGYKNLCKLISFSYQDGFYFKPRIDYRMLEKHHEGLIATSACLGGHIPKLLMANDYEKAHERVDWFLDRFGPERFYLEIQPEDQTDQATLNQKLYTLAAEKNISLVATGDSHYVHAQDRQAHEIMLALQTHDTLDNPNRYTFGDCRVHMRTQDEMLALFPEHESAIWNTGKIADMCTFDFQTDKLFFPKFAIPENHTQESYFTHLCERGLETLKQQDLLPLEQYAVYQQRLKLEMDLIISMGFVGYFLVVSDFIQWAKRNQIPVGPGRGSAAGSLVSWALEITNIDPIKYNLLFERFLNPERITMPDIDIDFCIEGRDTVINYVRDKYGHANVCHIITFGTMLAKGVIKDVARVLGFSFEDSNAITSLIPDQLKITLEQAIEAEPRLKDLIENNPRVKQLFDYAYKLEGLTRHASKHAAGIVISPEPVDEVLPLYVPPRSNELVAQYAMTELESIGFLKIDFLGLKNLTLIDRVVRMIEERHRISINIDKLPLDDQATFDLICQGKTSGVFQLESDGLKDVLRKLQPDKFEDIIAVNALYRPGPLGSGMVDDYIARRHGRAKIVYLFDELEPILQETYGVIVYQEQVMKIASTIGGYSLGEADILRRAMGKKKADVMQEQRKLFLSRAQEQQFNAKKAGELFDLMAYFAGYGFNKSHSAAYALIAYQTAYLKANYPAEFMAGLISLEAHNAEKMTFYLAEAKEMGLELLPPNVNSSHTQFTVVDGKLLFGLHGIKNVGLTAIEAIISEREKKPFIDVFDLCKRVDLRTVNKRVLEHLIWAGAFDTLPGNRAQKTAEISTIIEQAIAYKKNKATGQMDLFNSGKKTDTDELFPYQPHADWSDRDKLEKEKEVMGFYVSAHPLETYKRQLRRISYQKFIDMRNMVNHTEQEQWVTGAGIITSKKEITTKKGDRMAFVQLEDGDTQAEVVIFPKLFKKVEAVLNDYHAFVVRGTLDDNFSQHVKIKAQDIIPIERLLSDWPRMQYILFTLPHTLNNKKSYQDIAAQLPSGKTPLIIDFVEENIHFRLKTTRRISLDEETAYALEKQYGITIHCV